MPQEVSDFLLDEAVASAEILCPNQLELDSFCGRRAQSLEDCVSMARSLLARGPQVLLVKHLAYPGRAQDMFEMLLVSREESWHLGRPLLLSHGNSRCGRPDLGLVPGSGSAGRQLATSVRVHRSGGA